MPARLTRSLAAIAAGCLVHGGAALAAPATTPAANAFSSELTQAPNLPWGAGCEPAVSAAKRTSASCGSRLVDGQAIPPPGAPPKVKRVIAAANEIVGKPYVWGGGHTSFFAKGYDCSGAVSYALHGAGLLATPEVSGGLASWGEPGVGRWLTVYANDEHVFMEVAGLRFDTRSDPVGVTGPRWKMAGADQAILPLFATRHPSAQS